MANSQLNWSASRLGILAEKRRTSMSEEKQTEKQMGRRLLYVKLTNKARLSGSCPHSHVLDCFRRVFGFQENEDVFYRNLTDGDGQGRVRYSVKGKGVLRGTADYSTKDRTEFIDTKGWLGVHTFKDEKGVTWQSSCVDYLDPVSEMFTNSLAFAYLTYFWGDVASNPEHIEEINHFLVAHGEIPIKAN